MIPAIWPGALYGRRYSIERRRPKARASRNTFSRISTPIPWNNTDGTPLSFTSAAVATIYFTPEGATEQRFATCGLAVDRQNESIILDQPSVAFLASLPASKPVVLRWTASRRISASCFLSPCRRSKRSR